MGRIGWSLSLTAAVCVGSAAGCAVDRTKPAEAGSVPDERRESPTPNGAVQTEGEAKLAAARRVYELDRHDEDAIIWYGRRLAYLGRYPAAIDVFSRGLELHPESHRLLRHRGHRFITVHRLDDAIADLERATRLIEGVPDAIEPDGLPNRLNIPTSTTHTNIHYHLGLAHYLQGAFGAALPAWRRCLAFSKNDDMRCAASYWLYLTLRRLERPQPAAAVLTPITRDMTIIENTSYHRLLLLFKGELPPEAVAAGPAGVGGAAVDDATVAYGVAMWHLLNGRDAVARARFRRIVEGSASAAFGYLAAEAELTIP